MTPKGHSVNNQYICPLCFNAIQDNNAKSQLTEEHVPQVSLGGKSVTLTCKNCNNSCGSSIDFYLLNTIKAIEQKTFKHGTDRNVYILHGQKHLNASIKIKESNDIELFVSDKNNNPNVLKYFQEDILLKDSIINVQNKNLSLNHRMFYIALLKNAYLILFSYFGYTFLMDKYYDRLRTQILNPNSIILPYQLCSCSNNLFYDGIYLTTDNRYRGFLIIYTLKSINYYQIMVLIPTPNVEYQCASHFFSKANKSTINILPLPNHFDYLTDNKTIMRIKNWCYGWDLIF